MDIISTINEFLVLFLSTLPDQGQAAIPGTRSIKRLKENALSVVVRFGDAQLERRYGILRERPVTGARYPAASTVTIDA